MAKIPNESLLDETIQRMLETVQSSSNLHTINSLENLTMEHSMDNSLLSTIDVPGQTKSKISPNGLINDLNSKLVIVMVGLPARGKSYLTKKITRYLNWLQYNTKIFNVGNTRRLSKQNNGPAQTPFEMSDGKLSEAEEHDASFFDPENPNSLSMRERWAMDTLDQLINYLTNEDGAVGIFDATNTTKMRRRHIIEAIRSKTPESSKLRILFLESICTNPNFIQRNIRLKLSGPDYKDKDPHEAMKDFTNRLKNYEKVYETLDDEEEQYYESIDENLQYIKIINAGKKITSYNISGFLSSQVVFFMLNFNLNERQIWISRHGETYDNLDMKLGVTKSGSRLTPLGERYAKCLAKFMNFKKKEFRFRQLKKRYFDDVVFEKAEAEENPEGVKSLNKGTKIIPELHFSVWSSMLRPTIETSQFFSEQDFNIKQLKMLNELSHGKVNGMTLKKFAQKFHSDFKTYQSIYHEDGQSTSRKKLLYRFPGGESHLDVINRLRPLIVELERLEDHVLLITHKAVARVLLSYFMNLEKEYITELDVPLHCVYVLEPKPYGVDWNMYQYNSEVDWFFPVSKEDILRKKKRREKIPLELVDIWKSQSSLALNKKNKKKPASFYIGSPSEPSTPQKVVSNNYFGTHKNKSSLQDINKIVKFSNSPPESENNTILGSSSEDESGNEQAVPVEYTSQTYDDESSSDESSDKEVRDEYWYYQLDNGVDEISNKSRNVTPNHGFASNSSSNTDMKKAEGAESIVLHVEEADMKKSSSTTSCLSPNLAASDVDDDESISCVKFKSGSSSHMSYNTPNTLSVNNSELNLKSLPINSDSFKQLLDFDQLHTKVKK